MLHTRLRIVFLLLVLIMLVATILFGVLTYWLVPEQPPASDPGQESRDGAWCQPSADATGSFGRRVLAQLPTLADRGVIPSTLGRDPEYSRA